MVSEKIAKTPKIGKEIQGIQLVNRFNRCPVLVKLMGERRQFCGNNSIIVTDFVYECLDVNDHQILKGNLRN
jgi:hypothetical protein